MCFSLEKAATSGKLGAVSKQDECENSFKFLMLRRPLQILNLGETWGNLVSSSGLYEDRKNSVVD